MGLLLHVITMQPLMTVITDEGVAGSGRMVILGSIEDLCGILRLLGWKIR